MTDLDTCLLHQDTDTEAGKG